jgi:N utilization substance protein B
VTVEARQLAVEALYEADQLDLRKVRDDLPPRVERLVAGVLEHQVDLDRQIDAVSAHWRIKRMPVVDRAILRLGLYELIYETGTPSAVVLAEAVRLAKMFGTEKSGLFVNGILAALLAKRSEIRDQRSEGNLTSDI